MLLAGTDPGKVELVPYFFCATVVSDYKMKEVLITLPTCLARFPPQLSEELANIRLDLQPLFLFFSNSYLTVLYKTFSCKLLFSYVLLKVRR